MNQNLIIVKISQEEDEVIARHYYQLWLDNNISSEDLKEDWREVTLNFITRAREELSFQAFAGKVNGRIVASVSCQLFAGLYPFPFKPSYRQYGYIWNVFVESDYRRQKIGTKLTARAIEHLRSLGCTHAILHASDYGKPVYESLGFIPKNEMILDLKT